MNRRVKVIIAVVLCVIPIAAVFLAWSTRVVRRHQIFSEGHNYFVTLEINVSIGWPYDEFKVELEITDHSEHILAGSAAIHDSEGGIIDTIIISDVGNYSTNWLPATRAITIIIVNQGWGWAFIEGEVWVWARYSYLHFWYGDN